ncbi:DUF1206 domain-containing protein [Qipengyuania marisflavi]|uniref:DUF1206 domain-containing protein n=1 Tax=Qipengyuania marisflavi TaxID=2486356 RepID=A0A5S3P8M4_9SPHN|nr:DUF1206 domain-containing protein [Qipengyuania marisflavi]TMM49852.1 DUF1206 domain-containing protein [Qipengyuania marisflavi]
MVDKSEKFNWLVRMGFAARGFVYVLLGYIALSTAHKAKEGASSSFDFIQDVPFGTPLLWVMALGLLAYAGFRFMSAISDIQHHGSDTKGILKRIGDAASGFAHLFLAYACYQFASGGKQSASEGGGGSQEMAGSVLSMDLGSVLIGILGIGFLVGAVMQAKKAITASFMNRISGNAPKATEMLGRVGSAARAVVFGIIGWSMISGAWFSDDDQIKGLGEAIVSLRGSGLMYTLVAVGLLIFGLFTMLTARYRIIPDFDKHGLKPKFRS